MPRLIHSLCAGAARRPWAWLLLTGLLTVPAAFRLGELGLDTDLVRLLPQSSPAARATRELDAAVGGGSYFAVLLEGDDPARLERAVRDTAERVTAIEAVRSVEFEHPVEFIKAYRYLLVPRFYLELLLELVLNWELEISPFLLDLEHDENEPKESYAEVEDRHDIERFLDHYGGLPRYHRSRDGRTWGLFVRPRVGVTSLGATRELYHRLEAEAAVTAERFDVWAGVSGSLRNKVDEYEVIVGDLGRSGLFASLAIVLTLTLGFRSIRVLPVVLYPVLLGLAWAFALVPLVVGDLNTITAFLLLVLFGMGVDYSIHLVRRFQAELCLPAAGDVEAGERSKAPDRRQIDAALKRTFASTGVSVGISGTTTALALFVLSASDFRGFSEFGMIGGLSILMVLLAMFTVMPSTLVVGARSGWVSAVPQPGPLADRRVERHARAGNAWQPGVLGRQTTVALALVVLAATLATSGWLRFDYDFDSLRAIVPEAAVVKEKQGAVYPGSRTPSAIIVADDVEAVDATLAVLEAARRRQGSTFGRITSVRDFAPDPVDVAARLRLIQETRDETASAWTRRIDDEDRRRWIEDLNGWQVPARAPTLEELPSLLRVGLEAFDDSDRFLVGLYPSVERSHGRNAMAFTEELYALDLPAGVRGPVGDTPVMAEILWLVTAEGPWLVAMTLLGVLLLVLLERRSLVGATWVLLPLVAGILLATGTMGAFGLQLNFFNVVVIPALLGLGVDHGVHYYRHWQEVGGDTDRAQVELAGPLTLCTTTTMMGYAGMAFAHHPGLRSLGLVACLGLACIWITSLGLLPGLLSWKRSGR